MTVSFNPENCVGCGLCERVCPKSAIVVYKTADSFKAEIDGCIDCGTCTVYCQYGALTLVDSPYDIILKKLQYSKTDIEGCVYCGVCAENCPRDAIFVEKTLDKDRFRLGHVEIGEGCIECRNCVIFCPTDAVRIVRRRPEIDESKCIYCEICQAACPKDVIEIHCDSCKLKTQYSITGSIHVDDSCSLCLTCEKVCQFDAIKVNRLFDGRQSFERERCIGVECSICFNICPNIAISYEYDEEGKVVLFSDSCNYCGKCQKYCPTDAIKIERWVSDSYEELHLPEERRGYHETNSAVKVSDACIGCHFCEAVCKIAKDGEMSHIRGEATLEMCTACNLCASVCPMDAIDVFERY